MGTFWEYLFTLNIIFSGNIMGYFWEYRGNGTLRIRFFIDERAFLGIFLWE